MLHIILLILKIIGFLLLGIIALLLILAASVILTPLVYKAELSADNSLESIKGRIHFHWLFHLLEGNLTYKDGEFEWRIRAAWKKFGNGESSKTTFSQPEEHPESPKSGQKPVLMTENKPGSTAAPSDGPKPEMHKGSSSTGYIPEKKEIPEKTDKTDPEGKKPVQKESLSLKTSRIYERFRKFKEKIIYTFRKICDKIKALKKKKERITAFLQNTIHKNAFSRLIREVQRLLRFLRPSKAAVDLEFGFTDPAYTGYTLAWISILYPMIGEFTQLKPDFEHRVFRGSLYLKGKFRILYVLIFVWNMLWDKNVRTTYRHIRKFRL